MRIKIVEDNDKDEFEEKVNVLLNTGYTILSSNCSMINSEAYDFANYYQAMLLTEEKTFTRKEIGAMSSEEFSKNEKAIMEQLRRGLIND